MGESRTQSIKIALADAEERMGSYRPYNWHMILELARLAELQAHPLMVVEDGISREPTARERESHHEGNLSRVLKANEELLAEMAKKDKMLEEYGLIHNANMIDIDSARTRATELKERQAKYEQRKCNSGHENNLPVYLWDCPRCTDNLRAEIKELRATVDRVIGERGAAIERAGKAEVVVKGAHDLLDNLAVFADDGTHPQLLERIQLLWMDSDKLRAKFDDTRASCVWREDEDGTWWTDCGEGYQFSDGGPTENKAKWCQYCGRALKEDVFDGKGDIRSLPPDIGVERIAEELKDDTAVRRFMDDEGHEHDVVRIEREMNGEPDDDKD